MVHKETAALWRWLRRRGWTLLGQRGHAQWRHPNGGRLTTSSTPKDPQIAARRARSDARRIEGEVKA